ncbi:hypothetical protein [Bartonella birtlesii]|nr:hypothetical protein [Bartonella birtlesii]
MVGALAQTTILIALFYKAMQFDQPMKELEKVFDAPLHRLKELRCFALEISTKIPDVTVRVNSVRDSVSIDRAVST